MTLLDTDELAELQSEADERAKQTPKQKYLATLAQVKKDIARMLAGGDGEHELKGEAYTQFFSDKIKELDHAGPDWMRHGFNKNKGTITNTVNNEKFLAVMRERLDIIVTYEEPDGHLWTGEYWRPFKKIVEARNAVKSSVIFELSDWEAYEGMTNQDINKLTTYVQAYLLDNQDVTFNADNYVNFANGTFDLETMQGHVFKRDDYLTSKLPVAMKKSVDGGLVAEYARYLLGDDAQTLIEWFGYMFFKDASILNALLFLQGVGGNGKSTLLKAMLKAFGENAGSISFEQLTGKEKDRFLDTLAKQWANIMTESDENIDRKGMALIKQLSAGDPITANPKGKDAYTFYPRAKFIVSANYRLPVFDNSKEYQRRLILLNASAPSLDDMPEADAKAIKEKYSPVNLEAALPEFIGYALIEAKKAMAAKKLTISDAAHKRTLDWLAGDDILGQFNNEYHDSIKGMYGATVKYIHGLFVTFMEDAGISEPWTANRLKNELQAKGFRVEPAPRRGIVEDAELIDDWNKPARNRVVGFGVKTD